MQAIRYTLQEARLFFSGFLLFIFSALLFLCFTSKTNGFLTLNEVHNNWLDTAFINITFLGDGIFSILAAIFLWVLFKKSRLPIQILAAFFISGILAQVLKTLFSLPRPKALLTPGLYKYFFEGITHAGFNSFPSGHTTSAFALATILTLSMRNKTISILFLFMAILIGYSRIYLGQHFLEDILAGALLGTVTAILVYTYYPGKSIVQRKNHTHSGSEFPPTLAHH